MLRRSYGVPAPGVLAPGETTVADIAARLVFYTKLHDRILGPLLSPDHPPAPPELRRAMTTIDHTIDDYIANARLKTAA